MMQLTEFEELENGDLKITLTPEGRKALPDLIEDEGIPYDSIMWELFETPLCNGYLWVQPEQIGALTSSPIIANGVIDEETTAEEMEETKIWYFHEYMLKLETEELLEKGFVIFTKAE